MLKFNMDLNFYSLTPRDYDKYKQTYDQAMKSLVELGYLFNTGSSPVRLVKDKPSVQEIENLRLKPSVRGTKNPKLKPSVYYTGKYVDLGGTIFRMRA